MPAVQAAAPTPAARSSGASAPGAPQPGVPRPTPAGPGPASAVSPRREPPAPPAARAPVSAAAAPGTKMPRLPLPKVAADAGGGFVDSSSDAKVESARVKRTHIPRHDGRKWSTVFSLLYPYDKIKAEFEVEGLFTRNKPKCWMAIYYDMILMYTPTKDGPPDMQDKHEGHPFDYFFLDNIIDSSKIVGDEAKLTIDLPTAQPKENLKIVCDTAAQYKTWHGTIVQLAKVFETTSREGISTKEEVDARLAEISKVLPQGLEPQGLVDEVAHTRAQDWLVDMKRLYGYQRKYLPFIARIERFSQYRIGSIAVYCNFFQVRLPSPPCAALTPQRRVATARARWRSWRRPRRRSLATGRPRWSASSTCASRCWPSPSSTRTTCRSTARTARLQPSTSTS